MVTVANASLGMSVPLPPSVAPDCTMTVPVPVPEPLVLLTKSVPCVTVVPPVVRIVAGEHDNAAPRNIDSRRRRVAFDDGVADGQLTRVADHAGELDAAAGARP